MKKIAPSVAAFLCLLVLWAAPECVRADIPNLPGTQITIPWEQFQEMLRPLREQPGDAARPQGPAVAVESADYELFAGREQVKITAAFNITVMTGAWEFTPLADSGLILASFASSDAEDTVRLEQGAYQLFTKTPGARAVQLVLYAPGDFNRMENSLELRFREQANMRRVTVIVPEAHADIALDNAAESKIKQENGSTVLHAVPGAAERVTATWKRTPEQGRAASAAKPQPRVTTFAATWFHVLENELQGTANFNYDIRNTTLRTFKIVLPAGVSVDQVSGSHQVSDWKLKPESGAQAVLITLGEEATGAAGVTIRFKKGLEAGQTRVPLPLPHALGVDRESGTVTVSAEDNLDISVAGRSNLAPLDVSELHAPDALFGFKYSQTPASLSLDVHSYPRQDTLDAIIDLAGYTSVMLEDGKLLTMCSYMLRNNTRPHLRLDLDSRAEVWSAFVDDQPVKPTRNRDGLLLIPLPRGASQVSHRVELLYLQQKPAMKFRGRIPMELPAPDIQTALVMWEVYMPRDFDFHGVRGNIERFFGRPAITGGEVTIYAQKGRAKDHPELAQYAPRHKAVYEDKDYEYSMKGPRRQTITRLGDYLSQNMQVQSEMQVEEAVATGNGQGVLPIKIDLPTEGQYFFFMEIMPKKEKHQVSLGYTGGKYLRTLKAAGLAGLFLAAVAFGIGFWLWAGGGYVLERAVYAAVCLALWFGLGHEGLVAATLAVCAAALFVKYVLLRKKRGAGRTAALLVLAGALLAPRAAHAQGSVTLPWSDYLSIRNAIEQARPQAPELPFRYLVKSAEYDIAGQGDSVVVDAVLEIRAYGNDPVLAPLFKENVAFTHSESSVAADRFVKQDGMLHVLCAGPGLRTVRVRFASPESLDRIEGAMGFSVPQTPVTGLRIHAPGRKLEFTVSGAVNTVHEYPESGGTAFSAWLRPCEILSVRWRRKPEDLRPEERPQARVDATVSALAQVAPGLVSYTATLNYSINHTPVSKYELALPAGVAVLDVSGPNVRDIKIETQGATQTVAVLLSNEVLGGDRVNIVYEQPFKHGAEFALAAPRPLDAASVSGYAALCAGEDMELLLVREADATGIDPSELPGDLRQGADPVLFAYKFSHDAPRLVFSASRNKAVSVMTSVVNQAHYDLVLLEDGRTLGTFAWQLQTRGRQFFAVTLPKGAAVWSVTVNGEPVVASQADGSRVLVPVKRFLSGQGKDTAQLNIEIVTLSEGARRRPWKRHSVTLPSVEVPISTLETRLYVPKKWRARNPRGDMGKGRVGDVQFLDYRVPGMAPKISVKDVSGNTRGGKIMNKNSLESTSSPDRPGDDVEQMQNFEMDDKPDTGTDFQGYIIAGAVADGPMHINGTWNAGQAAEQHRGALPVAVTLPRTGRVITFTQHMITGTAPRVWFYAYPEPAGRTVKYAAAGVLFLALGAALWLAAGKALISHWTTGLMAAGMLALLTAHYYLPLPGFRFLFWVMVFATVVILLVRRARRRRRSG